MSLFKGLFGKGDQNNQKSASEQTVETIIQFQEREEELQKKKEKYEHDIRREQEAAKQFMQQGKKSQALTCIKKKKLYEKSAQDVDNLIMRVNEQRMMLENQRTTVQIANDMRAAAQAAKKTRQEMNIDNVDDIMDEIMDGNAEMQQINDTLMQPMGMGADLDESDLLAELDELQDSVADAELAGMPSVPTTTPAAALPSVPTGAPQKTAEELELEALEREMAA